MSAVDISHELEELHEIARALGGNTRSSIQEIVDRIEIAVKAAALPPIVPTPDLGELWRNFHVALRELGKAHHRDTNGGAIHLGTMLVNDGPAEAAYQKRRAARAKRKSR